MFRSMNTATVQLHDSRSNPRHPESGTHMLLFHCVSQWNLQKAVASCPERSKSTLASVRRAARHHHGTSLSTRSRFQGSLDARKNAPIVPTFDYLGDQREGKGRGY
jgi:hypothetical protein